MTSSERRSKKTRLLILLAGAVLLSLVLAFSIAPVARADSTTPELYGVRQVSAPQAFKATGQFVAQPTNAIARLSSGPTGDKGGPVPNDAPFGPNVRVTTDANDDTRPSIVVQPVTGYIFIAYQNFNGADWDIVLAESTDDGQTWAPLLSTTGAGDEINPSLGVTSVGTFILSWRDDAAPNVLPFAHSPDGVSWSAWTLDIGAAIAELSDIQYQTVVTQRSPGSYPDGIMFQMQAWCNDAANCNSGAHTVFWVGEQTANVDPTGWSFGLGGFYWLVHPGPGPACTAAGRICDPLYPAAHWSSGGYVQSMDEEDDPGPGWHMLWIAISEDGSSPVTGWLTVAVSDDAIFSAGGANGMDMIVAGTFRLAAAPTRHQIIYFYTTDAWGTPNGALMDPATTDQRALGVGSPPGAMADFHITYYSDTDMMDMVADTAGNLNGPNRVSDNTPSTGVNDHRATGVYLDDGGAPKVAWQDNRGANVDIYTAGYITWYFWLNSTCGGVVTPLGILVDGNPVTTPYVGRWADGTTHTLQVAPTTQPVSTCKRCVFSRWSDGTTNPLKTGVLADRNIALAAEFNDEYQVNFLTSPPNLDIIWKGIRRTTPFSAWERPGTYNADVPSPQPGITPDDQYVFDDWSDGITMAARTVNVAPPICTNLTANFHTQYRITITATPSGVGLMVGYDTTPMAIEPVSFWADPGSSHMLITFSPQPTTPVDTRYKFNRWAAPGPATWGYNITVSTAAIYTAQFDTQYLIQIRSIPEPGPLLNIDIGDCTPPPPAQGPMMCWETTTWNPTIILSTPQGGAGSQYVFSQWSDGNTNPVRSIAPITGPATYTSIWIAQYYLTMSMDTSCLGTLTPPTGGWRSSGETVPINWDPPTGLPPDERYMFDHWEGTGTISYSGSSQSSTVTMNSPITETAFCRHEFQITLDTLPTGRQYEIDGMAQSSQRILWWAFGSQHYVNVMATTQIGLNPNTRYVFTDWSDGTTNPLHAPIVVTGPLVDLTARFKTQHHITLLQIPTSPAGIGGLQCNGVPDCWYDEGNSAVISVTTPWPSGALYIRYAFGSWTGDASGTNPTYTFTSVNAPKTATANWATWFKITVTSAHGSPTCSNADCWYSSGSSASITVTTPEAGGTGIQYVFTGWSGDATGTTIPLSITMDASKNVTADWKTQYRLTITSTCGTITDCGNPQPQGANWYDSGTSATISVTATVTDGTTTRYLFMGWGGEHSGATNPDTFTMSSSKNVTVTWQTQFTLTITSVCGTQTGCGSPVGAGWYNKDGVAIIYVPVWVNATDGKTYLFKGWTGDITFPGNVTTVTMDAPKSVTATWEVYTPPLPPPAPSSDIWLWLIIIIIIVVVVALVLFFMMKRKKPAVEEEELPPQEVPPAPPSRPSGTPPPPKK